MRRVWCTVAVMVALTGFVAIAGAPDGAIFTTLPDGSKVNFNIYEQKPDVYLDGGPGDKAPASAAGLPEGNYVFQVTDPSGKVLLSVDPAGCRQFHVNGYGVIDGVIPYGSGTGCQHATGTDADHGGSPEFARTVQLCGRDVTGATPDPTDDCFKDTPNPGGEYKVWISGLADFLDGCAAFGVADGLSVIDCGIKRFGNAHGFVPRHTKTDNFKVGGNPREIDTKFHGSDGALIDGMGVVWTDTLGASNNKYSYWDPTHLVFHEAHVEDVENGTHTITLYNQPGCSVGTVYVAGAKQPKSGPQTVSVNVKSNWTGDTIFVDVYCR